MLLWILGLVLAAPCDTPDADASAELAALHATAAQQGARATPADRATWASRARARLAAGQVCSDEDARNAAALLRGGTVLDVDEALPLAIRADEAGVEGAGWLRVLVEDRWHVNHGEPQPWGTVQASHEGQACIYPIDPEVTDEERASRRVKPAQEAYAKLVDRAGSDAEPTAEGLAAAGLLCPPVDYEAAVASTAVTARSTADMAKDARRTSAGVMHNDLHPGALYGTTDGWLGNAAILPKDTVALHPLMRSAWAPTRSIQFTSSLLGLLGGPNLGVEFSPLKTTGVQFSLGGDGAVTWTGFIPTGRGVGLLTVPWEGGRVNLGAAVGNRVSGLDVRNDQIVATYDLYVRPEVGVDVLVGDAGALVFAARANVLADQPQNTLAINALYAHQLEKVGLSGGLIVRYFDLGEITPDNPFGDPSQTIALRGWLPLPTVQIWWLF